MYINMHGEMIGLLDVVCVAWAKKKGGRELKNRLGEPWNVLISIVVLLKTHAV